MATKEIVVCDICGQEMVGTQHDLNIKRTRKWYHLDNKIFCHLKDWYEIDVCESCAKEMIDYIKERRIK